MPTTPTTPSTPSNDPGVQGSTTERRTQTENTNERATSQDKPFTNSRGEPTIYPSEVFGLQNANNLTAAEADVVARKIADGGDADSAIEEAKSSRFVYRQTYEKVPAYSNALTAADARNEAARLEREKAEKERERSAAEEVPIDTSLHGQHGPFAEYREVDVSAKEVAEQTGLPVDATKTIQGVR